MSSSVSLLKRNPTLTQVEFSESWYKRHAALVVPFFLHIGVTYYAQIHAPLTCSDPEIAISDWDGAAELLSEDVLKIVAPAKPLPQWLTDYYVQVVLKDEKRLLVSPATEHLLQVPTGVVSGTKKVVMENGKALIEIPEEILSVFKEYEGRGEGKN